GGKDVSVGGFAGPISTRADQCRVAEANAGRGRVLILGKSAPIGLPKLEQGAVGEASVAISLRGGDQPRQQRRAHLRELRGDRSAQGQLSLPAAEQFGFFRRDERPGYG